MDNNKIGIEIGLQPRQKPKRTRHMTLSGRDRLENKASIYVAVKLGHT